MGRTIPTTSWTGRIFPGFNCMSIIITGLWDDTKLWEDSKLWWDDGENGTGWDTRPTITTNWN